MMPRGFNEKLKGVTLMFFGDLNVSIFGTKILINSMAEQNKPQTRIMQLCVCTPERAAFACTLSKLRLTQF
jgi:hypothetical protein